jgi:hypothetical protein
MWRLAVLLAGTLAVAGCGSTGDGGRGRPAQAGTIPGRPAQAAGAALAFAAHSDPEVAVVDGYAVLPPPVQRGEQPIDAARPRVAPCAQPPARRFTAGERAAIREAFRGRTVRFVGDPAAALRERQPGALVLVASRPLLGGQRGTVMVIGCVPGPQQYLVSVHWDGRAWRALATAAG